jgi:hypothetical protein
MVAAAAAAAAAARPEVRLTAGSDAPCSSGPGSLPAGLSSGRRRLAERVAVLPALRRRQTEPQQVGLKVGWIR